MNENTAFILYWSLIGVALSGIYMIIHSIVTSNYADIIYGVTVATITAFLARTFKRVFMDDMGGIE